MTRSLYAEAFSHVDDCLRCDLESRQLCPTGRALFEAAQEKCEQMVGVDQTAPEAKA